MDTTSWIALSALIASPLFSVFATVSINHFQEKRRRAEAVWTNFSTLRGEAFSKVQSALCRYHSAVDVLWASRGIGNTEISNEAAKDEIAAALGAISFSVGRSLQRGTQRVPTADELVALSRDARSLIIETRFLLGDHGYAGALYQVALLDLMSEPENFGGHEKDIQRAAFQMNLAIQSLLPRLDKPNARQTKTAARKLKKLFEEIQERTQSSASPRGSATSPEQVDRAA